MDPQRWERVAELFEASAELSDEERRRFLEERCDGDTVLLREVLELLGTDGRTGAYMEPPECEDLQRAATGRVTEDLSGERVGPYLLEGVIGRGGMGAVYRAHRAEAGFEQQVAIKLIRRGMDTDDILRRFQNERQVLADLVHPGIARLLDGGATDDGRPYLVMEIVDGQPIDHFCDAQGLDLEDRLRLFSRVCAAAHHAHERRVVHRDLKPSNILVTPEGEPKLLDFGIAKLVDATGSVRTVDVTATELRLMTPEYASPEQVRSGKVDARSDVYALGVVLYELLTGRRPYPVTTGLRSDLERAICETDPIKPSRTAESRRLRSQLAGDLDTVVLKALRKERSRRYSSARELAEDIERHLAGLPVLARPDTWRYRTAKFVRRNRVLVASAVAIFVVLVAGLIGTLSMFLEAESQRAEGLGREYVARIAAAASSLRSDDAADARRHLEAAPAKHRGWEWRHLMARTDTSAITLAGHRDMVTALAWSPDGALLATGSDDRHVILWDVETGEQVRTWKGFSARLRSLAFSSTGERLLAASEGKAVCMLDPGAESALWVRRGAFMRAIFHPSDELIACVSRFRVRILRADDGEVVDVLHEEGIEYKNAAFSPDGTRLFFVSPAGLLGEWHLERREVRVIASEEEVVDPLHWPGLFAFATDGTRIAVGLSDGFLQVWDTTDDERVFAIQAHGDRVMGVDFDPDAARIATGSMDRAVKTWDAETGELIETLLGHELKIVRAVFDPTGERLATGSSDRVAKIWNLSARSERRIQANRGWRMGLALHPEGTRLAVSVWERWGGDSVGVASWDLAKGELLWTEMFETPEAEREGNAAELEWTADGRRLFSSNHGDRVRVLDAETGELLDAWPVDLGPLALALSPDGTTLAAAKERIRLLDARDGALLATFPEASGEIRSLAFDPRGRLLLSSSEEGVAQFWDVATASLLAELPQPAAGVTAVAISPDGAQLATAGAGASIRLWSAAGFTLQATLEGHTAQVRDIAYSPDGKRMLSGSVDKTLKLWDPEEAREVATLHGHEGAVDEVEFSRDGCLIVSQDRNGVIRIWDAPPEDPGESGD